MEKEVRRVMDVDQRIKEAMPSGKVFCFVTSKYKLFYTCKCNDLTFF
jgi:hypothetical protein